MVMTGVHTFVFPAPHIDAMERIVCAEHLSPIHVTPYLTCKKKIKNTVHIIGPTFSTFNWQADVFELKRMLSLIGIRVNTVMSAGATVAALKKGAACSSQPVHLPVMTAGKSCEKDEKTI